VEIVLGSSMIVERTLASEYTESESLLILVSSHSVDCRLASGGRALVPSEESGNAFAAVELGVV
jgi:hypothetical protein